MLVDARRYLFQASSIGRRNLSFDDILTLTCTLNQIRNIVEKYVEPTNVETKQNNNMVKKEPLMKVVLR